MITVVGSCWLLIWLVVGVAIVVELVGVAIVVELVVVGSCSVVGEVVGREVVVSVGELVGVV
jgi:hypothetical protein